MGDEKQSKEDLTSVGQEDSTQKKVQFSAAPVESYSEEEEVESLYSIDESAENSTLRNIPRLPSRALSRKLIESEEDTFMGQVMTKSISRVIPPIPDIGCLLLLINTIFIISLFLFHYLSIYNSNDIKTCRKRNYFTNSSISTN